MPRHLTDSALQQTILRGRFLAYSTHSPTTASSRADQYQTYYYGCAARFDPRLSSPQHCPRLYLLALERVTLIPSFF
ncbi:hypothetical protein M0802_007677 [Mischocyttarus mexicanus]|nr:hypothetical protein M0802_007677 [Mischocyttarus mexicanus]